MKAVGAHERMAEIVARREIHARRKREGLNGRALDSPGDAETSGRPGDCNDPISTRLIVHPVGFLSYNSRLLEACTM